MQKKAFFLFVLSVFLSLSLTANAADEKTEIVFWYSLHGFNARMVSELVDRFNESQDKILVNAQYQGVYEDAFIKLKAAGMGQIPCDLVQSYEIGARFIIDSGWMVPMQNYIDREDFDVSIIEPNLFACYVVDGIIHAMPFHCSTALMFYNKTAFDEAGIDKLPTTIEETIAIAPQLTTFLPDGSVDRYGYMISNYGWFFEQWVSLMGMEYVNNDNGRTGYSTKVMFGDNGAAFDIFNMWAKIAKDENTIYVERGGTVQARVAFIANQTAAFFDSTSNLSYVLDAVDNAFEVGVASFPSVNLRNNGGVIAGSGGLWMVDSGNQEKMDATWEFVKYLVSADAQAIWSAYTGYFPINMEAHDTEILKRAYEKRPQLRLALDHLHMSEPKYIAPMLGVLPQVREHVEDITASVVRGKITPEEAIAELVKRANLLIELSNLANLYDSRL